MFRMTTHRVGLVTAISAVLILCAFATNKKASETLTCPDMMTRTCPTEAAQLLRAEVAAAEAAVRAEEFAREDAPAMAAEDVTNVEEPAFDEARQETEAKVRQAARDFVKAQYPEAKTDGVFLLPFRVDSLYVAGVDTQLNGAERSRMTIDLLVRQYVRKNGTSYWRAESLSGEQARLLQEIQGAGNNAR